MADDLIQQYLDGLLSEYHYLDFRGIMQLEKVVELELDEIFVHLKVVPLSQPDSESLDALERRESEARASVTLSRAKAKRRQFLRETLGAVSDTEDDLRMLALDSTPLEPFIAQVEIESGAEIQSAVAAVHGLEMAKAGEQSGEPKEMGDVLRQCRQLVMLGDPGSGKTTLVKWLARTYALGREAVKERLGLDEDLVPIVVSIAAYGKARKEEGDDEFSLLDYIERFYDTNIPSLGKVLRQRIDDGGAVVFFDGLDEVVDVQSRIGAAADVHAAMRSWAERPGGGSRGMITSRVYGYDICRIRDVVHWQLASFDRPQIEQFIRGWSWGLERALRPKAPRRKAAEEEAASLTHAIFDPGSATTATLQTFAENPLLLTILALVKRQYGVLPDLRAQLYNVALKTLVGTWNKMRGLGGPIEGVELPTEKTIQLWEPIALWMHMHYPGGTAPRREITGQLAARLVEQQGMSQEAAIRTAESYLDTAAHWAGLLIERGPNVFGFMHQTFQEYLAARALVRVAKEPYDALRPYFFQSRWREVVLLAAGYIGAVQERVEDATRLVDTICRTEDRLEPNLLRYHLLAATLLADRVPVAPRCFDDVLASLAKAVEACSYARYSDLSRVIASLAGLAFSSKAVGEAIRVYGVAEPWTLRAALVTLAVNAPQDANDLLELGLADKDLDVRGLAAASCVAAGRTDPEIALRMKTRWFTTNVAVLDRLAQGALDAAWSGGNVHPMLLSLLSNKSYHVRLRAAMMLLDTGYQSEEVEHVLLDLISQPSDQPRWVVSSVLGRFKLLSEERKSKVAQLLSDGSPEVRLLVAETFLELDYRREESLQTLTSLFSNGSTRDRVSAAKILHRTGYRIEEAGRTLIGLLSDASEDVRQSAMHAILRSGPLNPEAGAAIAGLLADESADVRLVAAEALERAQLGNAASEQTLANLMSHDSPQIRLRAAMVLTRGKLRGVETERVLIDLLMHESADVRLNAVRVIRDFDFRDPNIAVALVRRSADVDPNVRAVAAEALRSSQSWNDEMATAVASLLVDKSAEIRFFAAETLARKGSFVKEAERVLAELLSDASSGIRLRAAIALCRFPGRADEAVQLMVGLLSDDSDEIRKEAATNLGQSLSQQIENGEPEPAWLATRRPQDKETTTGRELSTEKKTDASLQEILDLALTVDGEQRTRAMAQLRSRLHVGAQVGHPRDLGRGMIAQLLAAVAAHPRGNELATGNPQTGELRATIISALVGRFEQLAIRREEKNRQAARDERDLVRALPDVLCLEVLDQVLDDLSDEARDAACQRVLGLSFEPEGSEAQRAVGLYSTLAQSADAASFKTMHRRVAQAVLAAAPPIRKAAMECLATFLPKLVGKDRRRAFDFVLTAATEDDDYDVRQGAAWALRMGALDLNAEEATAVERARLPALGDLQ